MRPLENEEIFSAGQGWWLSPYFCSADDLAVIWRWEISLPHREYHCPAKMTHFSYGWSTCRSPYVSVWTIEQWGCSCLPVQYLILSHCHWYWYLGQLTRNGKALGIMGSVPTSVFWLWFSKTFKAKLNRRHVSSLTETPEYFMLLKIRTCLQVWWIKARMSTSLWEWACGLLCKRQS